MKEFAEQELGVEFKFDSLINPRIDCSQAPLAVRLSPEEVVAIDMHWPKVAAEHGGNLKREIAAAPQVRTAVYSCGGGLKSFAIDPYGRMSICVLSHQETYNVRAGSVRQGWEHFLLNVRQRERQRPTKCSTCRIRSVCSMCPASGELENGDPESPVDFLCEVAHLRAMVLGFQIPEHGECEFCVAGERRGRLVESAERISSLQVDPSSWSVPQTLLPILNNSASATGCGGCGVLH